MELKCNEEYFIELLNILNDIKPEYEKFKKMNKFKIKNLKLVCEYYNNICKKDCFFFEDDSKQIILGRYQNTLGCYYKCNKYYFTLAIDPFSLFKNDLFIRYIIDKPELFITSTKKIKIEHVFPIRIVLSENYSISDYSDSIMYNIKDYIGTNNISTKNALILNSLPKDSILKNLITKSNIITREICMLYYMKFYFYIIEIENNKILPFILVSKYNIENLNTLYKKLNKPVPKFKYVFI